MKTNLIIFLCVLVLIFLVIIFSSIKRRKVSIQYSLLWISFSVLMLISLALPGVVKKISEVLGFEVASNMIFLIGFILLLVVTFILTTIISNQKQKIVTLTQEVAIMNKKVREQSEKDYL